MSVTFRYQDKQEQVQEARLSFLLNNEGWDEKSKSWIYGVDLHLMGSLEVHVNEQSGEDGAASPDASWRIDPVPADVFHHEWTDESDEFEAWFGNDAPELENNHLRLKGRNGAGQVLVHWTSEVDGETVEVEGWFDFDGITGTVLNTDDIPNFVAQVWPDAPKMNIEIGEAIDYGKDFPAKRRIWYPYKCTW